MKHCIIVGILVVVILCIVFYRLINTRLINTRLINTNRDVSNSDVFVQPSPIQGEGLFANRRFVRGELILSNLFPGKDEDELLYDPIPDELFYDYMGYEAGKLNHCVRNANSYVFTKDKQIYQLFASRTIEQGDEITVNYNQTHKRYPFIGPAKPEYTVC